MLYPRIELPGPVRIMDEDVELIAKARDFAAEMAKSPYYITPKYSVKDVERYSDGLQDNGNQRQSLASQLSPVMKAYLPPELLDRPSTAAKAGADIGLKPLPAFDAKSLSALEDKERKNAETGGAEKEKEKEKDDSGNMSDLEGEMEEEEQDDDYAVDHYESGDDDSAGDDEPAAVF